MRAHHKKRTKNSYERRKRQRLFVVNVDARPDPRKRTLSKLASILETLSALGLGYWGVAQSMADALGLEYAELSELKQIGFVRVLDEETSASRKSRRRSVQLSLPL